MYACFGCKYTSYSKTIIQKVTLQQYEEHHKHQYSKYPCSAEMILCAELQCKHCSRSYKQLITYVTLYNWHMYTAIFLHLNCSCCMAYYTIIIQGGPIKTVHFWDTILLQPLLIMRSLLKCWEITAENNKRQFF